MRPVEIESVEIESIPLEGQNADGVWKHAELVEFIWFSFCFHVARCGREGWLTWQSFDFC